MKGKRFAALGLAVFLTLSLLVVPAGAVSFTDMQGHWAQEDVEFLAGLGIVKGTSATTFAPAQKMTACEALLFCSRTTGVSAADKQRIAADRAAQLREILPGEVYSWAEEEMAVCLETGIISESELRAMCISGALLKSITRESLSMYLVRAMQLAPMAASLTSYPMSFADTVSISQVLRPYVYLLNTYGIVLGNTANQFMPRGSLTRAEMATMLRRAIDFMDEQGIYAELPAYTDYDWVGGVIDKVETTGTGAAQVTFTSALTGTDTVALPAGTAVYENNIRTTAAALRQGKYVRVNLSEAGTAQSARLGGAVTAVSGTVTAVSQDSITINVDGISKRMDIDRFTKVQVGSTVGDASLIDGGAGYTQAQCWVDSMGHLAELRLSGDVLQTEGFLTGTAYSAGSQVLTVITFDGRQAQYPVAADAEITVDGKAGSITSSAQGAWIGLEVSEKGAGSVTAAALDTQTDYVTGPVEAVSLTSTPCQITIRDALTGRTRTCPIASNAAARYNGAQIAVGEVAVGSYATVRLSGGQAVELDTYPGTVVTRGVLQNITYANPTTLAVRTEQGGTVTYAIDLNDLPRIVRDGAAASIDQLRIGDSVAVTVQFNVLTEIQAASWDTTVSGTITRVVQDTSGVSLEVALSDGTTGTYQVSRGASVTYKGSAISLYALKPGDSVELAVSGNEAAAIEVSGSASTAVQLSGSVLAVNPTDKTAILQLEDGSVLTVRLDSAGFVTASGAGYSLSAVQVGDKVQVYGQYSGGSFAATLVIRL